MVDLLHEEYPDVATCHHCNGDCFEPMSDDYEMTYMDYVCGPRTCCICYGRGTFSQMEENERYDRSFR